MEDVTKVCAICNHTFKICNKEKHLLKEHGLTFEEYVLKFIYNGIAPTCKCGCGNKLTFNKYFHPKYYKIYLKGHRTEEDNLKYIQNRKYTNIKKYGVDNVFKLKYVQDNIKKTNLNKYGFENPMQHKDIQNKAISTNIKKYGAKNAMYVEKFKETLRKTNLEKYGFENCLQNKQVIEKRNQTNLKKYGAIYVGKNTHVREKIRQTNLKRYGYENNFLDPSYRKLYNKHSKDELRVCELLNGESGFRFNGREYDIKVENNLFEIDGDYFHTSKLTNLNTMTVGSIVNDHKKIKAVENSPYKLYKIFISNLPTDITVENLIKNSYVPNFELNYEDIIVSKETLQKSLSYYYNRTTKDVYTPKFVTFLKYFYSDILKICDKKTLKIAVKNIIGMNDKNYILDFSIKNVVEEIEKIKTDN